MIAQMDEEKVYPSIVFEVGNGLFSVDSRYIETIMQLPPCEKVPDARPEIKGIFHYRGKTITMFDLRLVMKMNSREKDFSDFCDMIDARKADHINWVNALDETASTDAPFRLATDYHQCALGRWCDSFQCDVAEVNYQINRISEPHRLLHETAEKVHHILEDRSDTNRHESAKAVVTELRKTYMNKVLDLLDETKNVFRDSYFREMALVLSGDRCMGLVADNILAVEELTSISDADEVNRFLPEPYLTSVMRSKKIHGLILGLDIPKLLDVIGVEI